MSITRKGLVRITGSAAVVALTVTLVGGLAGTAGAAPQASAPPPQPSRSTVQSLPDAVPLHPVGQRSQSVTAAQEPNPAGCVLDAGYTHLRTSADKNGVGIKPSITCDYPVDSLAISDQMWKYHFFGLVGLPEGNPSGASNAGEASLTDRKLVVLCTNSNSTTWFGTATGTAVIDGVPYEGAVRSNDATFDCGT